MPVFVYFSFWFEEDDDGGPSVRRGGGGGTSCGTWDQREKVGTAD